MRSTRTLLVAVLCLCSCCTTRTTGPVHPVEEVAREQSRTADEDTRREDVRSPAPDGLLEPVVNKAYEDKVLALINSATTTLRIVHFSCNDDSTIDGIVAAMKAAAKRGVDVQVLLEGDVDDNAARVTELTQAGISAKLDTPKRYTHSKLVVADRARSLFGSTNFSYKSIRYNNETNLYIECAATGDFFHRYAESLWNNPEKTPELAPANNPGIGLLRTLKSGDYVDAVTPLLTNATKRIDLLVYGYNLNPKYPDSDVHKLTQLLVEARERGVQVRVVLELSDYNDTLNELNQAVADHLASKCIPVRFDPIDIISHAKLLLVDDVAVVGSNNWGHGGFHLYQEVGAVTNQAAAVSFFASYFDGIWAESSVAAPGCR